MQPSTLSVPPHLLSRDSRDLPRFLYFVTSKVQPGVCPGLQGDFFLVNPQVRSHPTTPGYLAWSEVYLASCPGIQFCDMQGTACGRWSARTQFSVNPQPRASISYSLVIAQVVGSGDTIDNCIKCIWNGRMCRHKLGRYFLLRWVGIPRWDTLLLCIQKIGISSIAMFNLRCIECSDHV